MTEVKPMTYSEKHAYVKDYIEFDNIFIPPFIIKHLGDEALSEFNNLVKQGIKPIPDALTDQEKYELAYENWIWTARNTFSYIRKHMGEVGIEQFKRTDIDALKQKNATPALLLLKLIRALAAGTAFKMTAKKAAYQLQWISPYSVRELNKERLVLDVPNCKILNYPDSEDLCLIG